MDALELSQLALHSTCILVFKRETTMGHRFKASVRRRVVNTSPWCTHRIGHRHTLRCLPGRIFTGLL